MTRYSVSQLGYLFILNIYIAFPDWVFTQFARKNFCVKNTFGNPRLPPGATDIQPLQGCAV
jgi:hypothetical protein